MMSCMCLAVHNLTTLTTLNYIPSRQSQVIAQLRPPNTLLKRVDQVGHSRRRSSQPPSTKHQDHDQQFSKLIAHFAARKKTIHESTMNHQPISSTNFINQFHLPAITTSHSFTASNGWPPPLDTGHAGHGGLERRRRGSGGGHR